MTTTNDGGPAFPVSEGGYWADPQTCKQWVPYNGMSLRDYFAAKAMASAMVNASFPGFLDPETPKETMDALDKACVGFYRIADSMLKARDVKS